MYEGFKLHFFYILSIIFLFSKAASTVLDYQLWCYFNFEHKKVSKTIYNKHIIQPIPLNFLKKYTN